MHPLGDDAPITRQLATSPKRLAEAFDIPATQVDGSDASAVHRAVKAAKKATGPALIEARLVPGVDLVERNRST